MRSHDAEWIEVRPKRKQISLKKTGNFPSRLDFDKNIDKIFLGNNAMVSPANFQTRTYPDKRSQWIRVVGIWTLPGSCLF